MPSKCTWKLWQFTKEKRLKVKQDCNTHSLFHFTKEEINEMQDAEKLLIKIFLKLMFQSIHNKKETYTAPWIIQKK